jgi:hypothetical protein
VAPPLKAANPLQCQALREKFWRGDPAGTAQQMPRPVRPRSGTRSPPAPGTAGASNLVLLAPAPEHLGNLPRPHRRRCSGSDGARMTPCRVALSARSRPCGASAESHGARLVSACSGARLRPPSSWGLYRRQRGLCRGGGSANQRVAGIIPGGMTGQTSSRFSNSLPSSCPR